MIITDLSNSFYPVPKPKDAKKNVKETLKSGSKNVIKKKSSKLAKLEKNRFSIITKKVDVCYICKSNKKEDWHEVIEGKNRQVSMKYGLVIPICRKCHEIVTNDKTLQEKLHKVGQKAFKKQYKSENFVQVFRKKLFIGGNRNDYRIYDWFIYFRVNSVRLCRRNKNIRNGSSLFCIGIFNDIDISRIIDFWLLSRIYKLSANRRNSSRNNNSS